MEEILAKSKQENQYKDEYNRGIVTLAMAYGAVGMIVIVIVLCAVRFFVKGELFLWFVFIYVAVFSKPQAPHEAFHFQK